MGRSLRDIGRDLLKLTGKNTLFALSGMSLHNTMTDLILLSGLVYTTRYILLVNQSIKVKNYRRATQMTKSEAIIQAFQYSAEHANGLSFFVVPRKFQDPSRIDKFRRVGYIYKIL